MKIHSLTIKNFRAIEKISIDFTNKWSQPRRVTLIVGPNGSGKTSILDAILMVVRTSENLKTLRLRDGLEFSPAQLVRGRGKNAEIQFEYSIEKDEALKINEVVKEGKIRLPLPFPENDFSIPPFKPNSDAHPLEDEPLCEVFEKRNLKVVKNFMYFI